MENHAPEHQPGEDAKSARPNFLQVMGSVLAAIFGVQSSRNRERDFTQGRFRDYLGVYIAIVVLIVAGMVLFVRLVLSQFGAG